MSVQSPFESTIQFINDTGYTSTNRHYLVSDARRLILMGWNDAAIAARLAEHVSDSTHWNAFVANAGSTSLISNYIYSPSNQIDPESLNESVIAGLPKINTFRVTALPVLADLVPNSFYYHPDAEGYLTITATGLDGTPITSPSTEDFKRGGVIVFETWADMNAQTPEDSVVALVLDATGDTENVIESGSASYIWNADDIDNDGVDETKWHLTAEHDTINVNVAWDSITDNPVTEDSDGRPEYNGDALAYASDFESMNLFSLTQW